MKRKKRVNTEDARGQEIIQSPAVTEEDDQLHGLGTKEEVIQEVYPGIAMKNQGEGPLPGLDLSGTVHILDPALEVDQSIVKPAESPAGDPVLPAVARAPLK